MRFDITIMNRIPRHPQIEVTRYDRTDRGWYRNLQFKCIVCTGNLFLEKRTFLNNKDRSQVVLLKKCFMLQPKIKDYFANTFQNKSSFHYIPGLFLL